MRVITLMAAATLLPACLLQAQEKTVVSHRVISLQEMRNSLGDGGDGGSPNQASRAANTQSHMARRVDDNSQAVKNLAKLSVDTRRAVARDQREVDALNDRVSRLERQRRAQRRSHTHRRSVDRRSQPRSGGRSRKASYTRTLEEILEHKWEQKVQRAGSARGQMSLPVPVIGQVLAVSPGVTAPGEKKRDIETTDRDRREARRLLLRIRRSDAADVRVPMVGHGDTP